jgi:cholesterol transport system auxiliary component
MKATYLSRVILVAFAAALSASALGCAFFTKSKPVMLRYFTPETTSAPRQPAGVAMAMRPEGLDLRLGRVNAASYLKDRIAFRDRSFEIGYYEELRWTEKPEAYLRRALGRALFEEQGVRQIVSGVGTTLDVDLDAFEEVRSPRHEARIQITWALRDDERVRLQETFAIDRPIASAGGPGELAAAMAGAFDESVRHVVVRVMAALAKDGAGGHRSESGACDSP